MNLDTQQVEIVGRNLLVSLFIADGIEIAEPVRDNGIDLIAYKATAGERRLAVVPVQLKAFTKEGFSVHAKYEKFHGIVMAYVWYSTEPLQSKVYVMTYTQAFAIAEAMGWTETKSWIEGGGYSTSYPSKQLKELLSNHRYTPGTLAALFKNN